ncbi:sensor histidine kinase [Lentilactobacillus farraginis]|uniref:histidine kinase n=1 Tax=Lentilactobacillus farraginis DSM 18382 = JCM 14108 TaxID=1423743 RepID=X0PCG8_9LACO|nr:sensor histidine kinase [Lentilactobacillus farraginis]KRM05862.1 histidine protein kinase [Lentilactobacillus farraginis DSM 18382 = JCM 14108]GAF38078.1 sensor histidine kinase [Lentilactobacillus farraginis DSM 18382 = JCM 14108]
MFKGLRNSFKNYWYSYIWLIFLVEAVDDKLPPESLADWGWIGLTCLFLVAYIATAVSQKYEKAGMVGQVIIGAIFTFGDNNFWLMIFPAWQVSSVLAYAPKKYFKIFVVTYYAILFGAVIKMGIQYAGHLDFWSFTFPMVSPIFAYGLSRSIKRTQDLARTNQRLESVIKRGERERIARDLHDTLGQSFSMITVKSQLAKKLLEKQPEKVPAELDDIIDTSRQNLQLVRNIVNDLRREMIDETMLNQQQNLQEAGITLQTTGESTANEWPTTVQTKVTPLLQEAVTNVIRHSQATLVRISFTQSKDDHYQITVQDNGHGLKYSRSGSHGISGMRERVEADGGQFNIQANKIGTLVTITLPKEGES